MKKWVAAAAAVIVVGAALTIYELSQEREPETPVAEEPAPTPPALPEPEEPPPALTVVPEPVQAPTSQAPMRLPRELTGRPGIGESPGPLATVQLETPMRREGTALVDVRGSLVRSGNRFVFQPADGSGALILLENQLLERVEYLQAQGAVGPGIDAWILSGIVTEYREANYLLIQRLTIESE